MKVALLITTYNWVEALNKCLQSVMCQTYTPDEIIIADDGSTSDTKALIESYRSKFTCSLIHSWQEDKGFRLSRSRNKALSKATADYVIIIDGDIVLDKNFIHDHVRLAEVGHFVTGKRVRLNESYSHKIIKNKTMPSLFFSGVHRGREYALRSNLLCSLKTTRTNSAKNVHGCNMAFWRDDLINTNGFNSAFVGWGAEDREICERLFCAGIKNKRVSFNAIAYHLYHPESSRALAQVNEDILMNTITNKLTRCDKGLNEFYI